ncbi:MAG: cobalt-precorrin-5B (C(1))-methyltransferase CbiD [Ruthenibacterium lactatiformans]
MPFEHYIQSGGKRLRCGYTTGTCAALAAAGAARLLLGGRAPESVTLTTPGGLPVTAAPRYCRMAGETACCAVEKDGGDDIDATHGALIEARVERAAQPGVVIDGGPGVGRVTKPGLDQPVGAAAINRVPRRMIEQAVRAVCDALNWDGGLRVTICVPEGAALAKKTFNPQLGIEGGISILGTSGIVEPMSMQALIDTVALSLRQARAQGAARVLLTPGNYGVDFLREQGLDAAGAPVVKCSNFIGDALDEAAALGFADVLLVGHIGKLAKLAGGVMNTHSRYADCRTELLCAHAAVCGASQKTCAALLDAATTDACIALLDEAGLRAPVLDSLLRAVERHLVRRAAGAYRRWSAVLFSNEYGLLGRTASAAESWRNGRGKTMKKAFLQCGRWPRRRSSSRSRPCERWALCPVVAAPQTKNGVLALSIARQAVSLEGKTVVPLHFTMSRDKAQQHAAHLAAAQALRPHLDAGRDVAMLNLGDVSIYATAAYLADILAADGYEMRMVPGVTSFCAVAARLNTSLTGIDTPLHIVPGGCGALEECLAQPGAKVLMKSGRQLPGVLAALERRGLLERSALVSNCGLPGEQVYADLSVFPREQDAGYFATIIVKED